MTRTAFAGSIVLVEGPSDSRFLVRYLLPGLTQIVICSGKPTALGAMISLAAISLQGFVAVVDRDFDDHLGLMPPQSVFLTDTHDVETLLLSRRLDLLLLELGDASRLAQFCAVNNCSIADALLKRCEWFSRLRFLNEVSPAFKVDVETMSPWKYTDILTWQLDSTRLVADYAVQCGLAPADILQLASQLPPLNNWRGARGHDIMALLSIGLRQVLGPGKQVSEAYLSLSLRLAFNESDFIGTTLYADLKAWEHSSLGLPLLIQ